MPVTRATALAMSEEAEETRPRASRFREHTNTNNSIRPPPDELWKDLAIDELIDQFNEENAKPAVSRKTSANHASRIAKPTLMRAASDSAAEKVVSTPAATRVASAQPVTPGQHEGTFGRFQRAFASVFGSVLGKRKAAQMEAEREKEREKQKQIMDERKLAAEAAYHEAKDLGLLPTPKVFVRPAMAAKAHQCGMPAQPLNLKKEQAKLTSTAADAATPVRTPRTPSSIYRSSSKKDLNKQKKLTKRVSNLESKLASARKELQTVLHNDAPPVRAFSAAILPPSPDISQTSPHRLSREQQMSPETPLCIGKIVKKRKATNHESDDEYRPVPTDSDGDLDLLSGHSASERENDVPERSVKRIKSSVSRKNLKRQSSRLLKRGSRNSMRAEEPLRVVPDGRGVPDVPSIPNGVEGKKVNVRDDGYGGFGHEIF